MLRAKCGPKILGSKDGDCAAGFAGQEAVIIGRAAEILIGGRTEMTLMEGCKPIQFRLMRKNQTEF